MPFGQPAFAAVTMRFLIVLAVVLLYLIGWQRRTTAYEL
jgi:hypothetical protein